MPDFKVGDKVVYDLDAEINKSDGYEKLENGTFVVLSVADEFIYIDTEEGHNEGFSTERFKLAPLKSGFAAGDTVRCMDNSSLASGLKSGGQYTVTEVAPNCGTNCDSLFLNGIDGDYFCSLRFRKISDSEHVENSAENVHVDDDVYNESIYEADDEQCPGCTCPLGFPPCSHCVNHTNEDETVTCDAEYGLPESICHRCKGFNPNWQAPSPLWNQVMRGGSINGPWKFSESICPNCFIQLTQEQNIADGWNLTARNVHVDVQTVTPSGRVWNPITWLWDEPQESEYTNDLFPNLEAIEHSDHMQDPRNDLDGWYSYTINELIGAIRNRDKLLARANAKHIEYNSDIWKSKGLPGTPEESAEPEALIARLRKFSGGWGLQREDVNKAADQAADLIEELLTRDSSNGFVQLLSKEQSERTKYQGRCKDLEAENKELKEMRSDLIKLEDEKDRLNDLLPGLRDLYKLLNETQEDAWFPGYLRRCLRCVINILSPAKNPDTPEQIVEDAMRKRWDVQDEVDLSVPLSDYFHAIQVLRDSGMLKES